jgi:putative sterol carrier protein
MTEEMTAKMLVEAMPSAFVPEKAEGVSAVVQYELTGEGGGEWVITIADGACQVVEGRTETPTLTLTMDAGDYVDLISGTLNATAAFMSGKLKIAGDIGLATKLISFFSIRI